MRCCIRMTPSRWRENLCAPFSVLAAVAAYRMPIIAMTYSVLVLTGVLDGAQCKVSTACTLQLTHGSLLQGAEASAAAVPLKSSDIPSAKDPIRHLYAAQPRSQPTLVRHHVPAGTSRVRCSTCSLLWVW
jgi:hypothetical protein